MGKTGVFLQLGYELWKLVGRPDHTSPQIRNFLFVESNEELQDEESDDEEIQDEEVYFESQMTMEHQRGETTSCFEGEK